MKKIKIDKESFKVSLGDKVKVKHSLMKKILAFTVLPTLLAFACVFMLVNSTAKSAVTTVSDDLMGSRAQEVTSEIDSYFSRYMSKIALMRYNPEINSLFSEWSSRGVSKNESSYSSTDEDVYGYLSDILQNNDGSINGIWVADLSSKTLANVDDVDEGIEFMSNYDMTERPWYDKLISSGDDVIVSDPYEDIISGNQMISVIGVVYKSGSSQMLGVVGLDFSMEFLQNIGDEYTDDSSFLMVVSDDGEILYHPDSGMQNMSMIDAGTDERLISSIENMELPEEMQEGQGQIGAGNAPEINEFSFQDKDSVGVTITGEVTGWKIVYGTTYDEYTGDVSKMQTTLFIIFLLILIVLSALVVFFGRRISKPISGFAHTADRMAEGEVDLDILCKTNDEVGLLSKAMSRIVDRLKEYMKYIDEICSTLDQIADGNLAFELNCEYVGEFARIKNALINIQNSMVGTISDITTSADTVSGNADQIAASSQALAQGTTEQASAIEELNATIDEISTQITQTAEKAERAKEKANTTNEKLLMSDKQMRELQTAMDEISTASSQISNIISTIDSIAFQTNILALNAAIEAARAGAAGKGFAVVADEVRNLANKSSDAAKTTEALIEKALTAIKRGGNMSESVGTALADVVKDTQDVVGVVDDISRATNQEAESVSQVVDGIGQISSVVENNSAAAEEYAATGSEMAKQAETLDGLVKHFKLS